MSKKLETLITNAIAEGFVDGVRLFEESVVQTMKIHQILAESGLQVKDLVIDTIEQNQVLNESAEEATQENNTEDVDKKLDEFLKLLKEFE